MQVTRRRTSTRKNKASRGRKHKFRFQPFSRKQKIVLTWWLPNSPLHNLNGIICDGSVRSGKSMSMSLSFVMWAMESYDGYNFAMCGKTIQALRRNVINDLKRMLDGRGYTVEDSRSENMLTISKDGSENYFFLFGGNDERSQDKVQGMTLAGVFFDEAAIMPESFVNQATARCSVEGSKYWFNCNPAGSRIHWFKVNWINKYKEKEILYLHFTMDDNLSLSEKKKAQYQKMYVGVFYRRYVEGRWVAAEGAIYDMWDDDENIYDELSEAEQDAVQRRYVAVDYGTTNPMVFLDILDDGLHFYVENEYYYDSRAGMDKLQKTDKEYADDFEKFVDYDRSVTVIIDPSASSFRAELLQRGYHVLEADNDVLDGIRVTATLMQKRFIKIRRGRCPYFEYEVSGYVWDEKARLRGEEKPLKEKDHAMDAIRYLCNTVSTKARLAA